MCKSQEHYGWLEDENVVTISPWDEPENDGIYTLNAFDRPDVIPSDPATIAATGSDTFLLKIEYGSQFEYYDDHKLNRMYIYYRTSTAGPDAGVSVQYCLLSKSSAESGGAIQTYTYDVSGNTQTQHDHYIDVGQSSVAQPFIWSLEDNVWSNFVNPLAAKMHLPNITVLSVGDGWDNCSESTYICNVTHPNIAITVQVNWIDTDDAVMANNSETDPFDIIDVELECQSDITESLQIDTAETVHRVIHVRADDLNTFSYSSDAQKGSFDVCVFEDGASIKQVKVWPRDAWYVGDEYDSLTLYTRSVSISD